MRVLWVLTPMMVSVLAFFTVAKPTEDVVLREDVDEKKPADSNNEEELVCGGCQCYKLREIEEDYNITITESQKEEYNIKENNLSSCKYEKLYDCNKTEDVKRRIKALKLNWIFNEKKDCYEVPIAKRFENYPEKYWDSFVKSVYDTENWINEDNEVDFKKLNQKLRKKLKRVVRRRDWIFFLYDYSELTWKVSQVNVPLKKLKEVWHGDKAWQAWRDKHGDHRNDSNLQSALYFIDWIVHDSMWYIDGKKQGYCTLPLCNPEFKHG